MEPPDNRLADGDVTILLHYTKALRALQAALDDETQRTIAETLCATELLGGFEERSCSALTVPRTTEFRSH
jgi:hypothetical protein